MKRTHICLLSEQPAPNICPVLDKAIGATDVVFVVTEQMRERASWLREVLKDRRPDIRVREIMATDPYKDIDAIQGAIENEIKSIKAASAGEVFVNATGGTKPMAIGAHMAAFLNDVPAFYVHDDRVEWLNQPGSVQRPSQELGEQIRLGEFLLAHGLRMRGVQSIPSASRAEELIDELLAKPSAYATGMRALNFHASQAERSLKADLGSRTNGHQHLQAVLDKFQEHEFLDATRDRITFPDEASRFFCAGGWLEQHVMNVCRQIRGRHGGKFNDLQESVKVEYISARSKTVPNEIDVAALYDNRLHVIECKTRVFHDDVATETLYKLATLKRELGGIRARGLLVSYQPVEPRHRERAALLDVQLVAGDELRELPSKLERWLQAGKTS